MGTPTYLHAWAVTRNETRNLVADVDLVLHGPIACRLKN